MTEKSISNSDITSALPDTKSPLTVPGLRGRVTIIRDIHGIPHIRANHVQDAFFGQGFATAQDRLWHMDFDRRQAYGKWSELAGSSGLESDRMMRKFQIGTSVFSDYENLKQETREMFDSYASGVNAFIESTGNLPIEYSIVESSPEPWLPQDCMAVYKVRHIMMGVFEGKLWRAQLVNELGSERASELLLGYQPGHLLIAPPLSQYSGDFLDGLEHLKEGTDSIKWLKESPDAGSNSWALHGSKTSTGKPILAGDPHRGLDTPNCYYQNQVSCPDFDVIGLSFPGCPGFPHFGHNQHVAWCVTHAGADYQDLFVEKFVQDNLSVYEWRGENLEAQIKRETIKVAGAEDETIEVRVTRHGPIIGESKDGMTGLAFKYTSTETPNKGFNSLIPQMISTSIDDAESAMKDWVDPCNNYVFVDVHGDIRYLNRGKVPIRSMANAWLPVPGWTGEHEWLGNIPFDQLARITNPDNGYIVTANNRIVDSDYPHYIALEFAPEYRAKRIVNRIETLKDASIEDMLKIHSERVSIPALSYLPTIRKVEVSSKAAKAAQDILRKWNGSMDSDSIGATVYSAFRLKLHERVLGTLLGPLAEEALVAGGRGAPRHVSQLASHLVTQIGNNDESLLPDGESWDSVVARALEDGVELLITMLGDDTDCWEWGNVHHTNPVHPLCKVYPELAEFLNPPPMSMGGDGDTPQAGSYAHNNPFVITGTSVARYVFDTSDWNNSRWIVPLGSSGHPGSPHYADQAELWSNIETIPMLYSDSKVDSSAASGQQLLPA